MKIAIFGNTFQAGKSAQLSRLFSQLTKQESEIAICREFYSFLTTKMGILLPNATSFIEGSDFTADIAFSVGGDGTFLQTAQRVGAKQIPILGINTGHLGFLADISSGEMEDTLTEIFKNYYRVEERTVLHLEQPKIDGLSDGFALNEISISKRDSSSMIEIHASINGEYLTTYRADGLIIATPTGSTAYSMSANGPIISPTSPSIVLTPVAPHSLNVRPLVISDNSRIDLSVESRDPLFLVALDGRSHSFGKEAQLTITKAAHTIKVVKRHNHNFYETIRKKLSWGGMLRMNS